MILLKRGVMKVCHYGEHTSETRFDHCDTNEFHYPDLDTETAKTPTFSEMLEMENTEKCRFVSFREKWCFRTFLKQVTIKSVLSERSEIDYFFS